VSDYRRRLEAAKRASTAQLLFRCARLVNERALQTLPGPDEPRPRAAHMALLPHIELDGGTRVTDLATKLGVSKQAIAQLVDELQRMGTLQRTPDPEDGRAKRVCFTEEGKQQMLAGLRHLANVERGLAAAIGTAKMKALHEGLLALHDHLDGT
jgi:DNA-binding MarR family transcriptional regulator